MSGFLSVGLVRYSIMRPFVDGGLMESKEWSGLWMEDDGSSGVVTDVAVSALPRRPTAPRPHCRWVRIREPESR